MLHFYWNSAEITTVLHQRKKVNLPVSTDSTGVATVILYVDVNSQLHTPAALPPRLRTPAIHRAEGCVGWMARLGPTDRLHVFDNDILTASGSHWTHSAPYSVGAEHLFLQQRGGPGADVKNEWSLAHTSWPGHRKWPQTSQSLRCFIHLPVPNNSLAL